MDSNGKTGHAIIDDGPAVVILRPERLEANNAVWEIEVSNIAMNSVLRTYEAIYKHGNEFEHDLECDFQVKH